MDNLSSSELDSPSKTPLFIAVAAVIVGLVALGLAWMGFSKANELAKQVQALESQAGSAADVEAQVQEMGAQLEQVAGSLNQFSKNVNDALQNVASDITKVRSDVRKVAIEAGTARKMVEDLEEKGIQVVTTQPSASSSEAASATPKEPDANPGKGGVYTIKSGDTLAKIAAAYKIPLGDLQSANPGLDPRRLRIGQQIVIPAPSN